MGLRGRPPLNGVTATLTVTVRVIPALRKRLDRLARRAGVPRSIVVKRALALGCDVLEAEHKNRT